MKGIIGIKSLKIQCIIGHHPPEREIEQEIQVDIRLTTDFASCAESDQVEDTIDYTAIAAVCTEMAKSKKYHLLETFACETVQRLLKDFEIDWISIRVMKPAALPEAQYTFVEFEGFKER